MRQIFRSRRLETVEGVARMLAEHGIETYISERRSYKGNRRGQFSFTDSSGPEPALWIVNGADITRARELMAESGLLEISRSESSFAAAGQHISHTLARKSVVTASRVRIALMVVVLALAGFHALRWYLGV